VARTRLTRVVVPGLLGAAALLRLAYLLQNRHSPFFDHPIIDGWEYVARARVILDGGLLWDHVSIHAPLYPVLVALVFAATDGSFLALYALQHALGLATLLLVHRITGRAFGPLAANAALALAALSWVPVYYEGHPLAEALATFLVAAATVQLLRADEGGWRRAAAAGAILGLAAITRANVLAVAPLAAAWLAGGPRRRVARAASFLGAVALVILPVAVQNFRAEGDFVLIQANGGFNFYLAHNPDADGVHYLRPGWAWRRALREGERAAPEGPAARDRYWTRRALAYIADEPGRTIALLGKRLALFVSDCEIGTSEDPAWYRARFPALRWAPLGAGWATAFALLGIAAWRRRDRPSRPGVLLALLLLGHVATLLFFPYFSRYRVPALPFVWALGGAGAAAWAGAWIASGGRRRAALAVVLLGLLAATILDPPRLCPGSIVRIDYQLGRVAAQRGDAAAALGHFRDALRESPGDPDVLNNLGLVLDLLGEDGEARAHYLAALARAPDHAEALRNLAALDRDEGRIEEAVRGYEAAVREEPGESDAWNALGALYLETGRTDDALAAFRRAFELRPSDPYPAGNLGKVLLGAGRVEEARAHFERLRKKRPTRVTGLLGLARCETAAGRTEGAESFVREALRLEPAHAEARRMLEELRGRPPETAGDAPADQ
jgi:Flp pilus assembly protein TadD